ncbi:UNVERIFIED_CONTAM: putative DNA primase large subunit [Sesamum calycinum]|uniref:DNA primase large subunit n=1 Tax=Sesamum calycinum TaxID=2727403 RepID=A0AAW2PT74_9LAMI
MALPLGKLTLIVGAGLVGSVLAKEGRRGNVSDFLSGAFKVVYKQLKQDDSTASSSKPKNDSLMQQVNSLRQELQLLASSRSVTIVTGERSGSGKYGVVVIVVVVGYGYIWWKATKRHLSSRIDRVDCKIDECAENTAATKEEVSELRGDVKLIGADVQSVHHVVRSLGAASRPALELPQVSPSRTVSLPTNSLLEPPSPSTVSGSPKKPPSYPPPNSSQTKVSASGLKELNGVSNDVGVSSLGTPRGSSGIHAISEATNNDSLSTDPAAERRLILLMEIVGSRGKSSVSSAGDAFTDIQLYRSAPELEVRLEDFELYAVHRLRVLKGISDGLSRGKKPNEMEELVNELWEVNMKRSEASEFVNKDIISHFVLRLVYCREEELRKWFLSMETTLFRYRFQRESPEAQRALLAEFNLPYKAVSSAEYESVKDKLKQAARSSGQSLPSADTIFYKVPFEQVPDLVASRRVFILKGYAYVAMNQVVSLLMTQYRSNLSKALVLTNRKWTSMIREQEKDRLTPIVEALSTSYLGPDYSQPRECADISLKDIDQVAKSSFPLCMRHLFEKVTSWSLVGFLVSLVANLGFRTFVITILQLREDHHLKHGGRMQLGLFLKGVGLKLDDALAFWKAEFSRKVGADRFDKEYAYSIRHNYGKEGKRTDSSISTSLYFIVKMGSILEVLLQHLIY